MPRHALCLLWLICLLLPRPLSAQQLAGPGFETPGRTLVSASDAPSGKAQIGGQIAEGWQDNTDWADVAITYALDGDRPHSGRLSQKITVTRGFAQFVQPVAFRKGRYQASVWMRARPVQWVALTLRQAGAPYTPYGARPVRVGPQWTQVEVEGNTPAVAGLLIVSLVGTGDLWIDDAALTFRGDVPPPAQALSPPPRPIPHVFFGLNVNHRHDPQALPWPSVPFGTFRSWDSGVMWASVEPQRGIYDWKNMDADVDEAQRHGQQYLFTLGQTPRWASSRPAEPAVYGPGLAAPPASVQDWKDFVRAVCTRYRGRIAAYEVWNEPDITQFYTGTPAQLAALERATAEVVHETDPHALVVTAAVSGGSSVAPLKWLDDYLTAGGGQWADVYAFHLYNPVPEGDPGAVAQVRALLRAHGLPPRPIWNTESGWGWDGKGDPAQTSAFVGRAFALDWASGLARFCWYSWSEAGLVGIRPDAGGHYTVPTAGAVAYREVEGWLAGARMLSCASDAQGTWTCALRRPDGRRAWVVWNTEGLRPWPVPPSWGVTTTRDLAGHASLLAPGLPLTIGPAPLLLTAGG